MFRVVIVLAPVVIVLGSLARLSNDSGKSSAQFQGLPGIQGFTSDTPDIPDVYVQSFPAKIPLLFGRVILFGVEADSD